MRSSNLPSAFQLGTSFVLAIIAWANGVVEGQTFTNVTSSAGITHTHSKGSITEAIMTAGAAAGDVNGDGWVDLFITNTNGVDRLYENNGNGTFTDRSTAYGFTQNLSTNGAAFGDIDNDGDLDLYVTTFHESQFYLYVNQGGVFSEQAISRGAGVTMEVAHSGNRQGMSVSFGDFNNDGFLDLHTNEWRTSGSVQLTLPQTAARLLQNNGAGNPGHFTDVSATAGIYMAAADGVYSFSSEFADMNNDGWADLVVTSDYGTSRLFVNNHDGSFTDVTSAVHVGTDQNGMGSTVEDYDNDGDLDWFVTAISTAQGNRLYENQLSDSGFFDFSDVTTSANVRDGGWGWGTDWIDYDNDGDLDLVATNGFFNRDDQTRLYRNDGNGVFTDVATAEGIVDSQQGRGLLTLDFDNDGDMDILILNNDDVPILYRNDTITQSSNNGNSWIEIDVEGVITNRDGIGARIFIDPDINLIGDELYRTVSGGSHYLAQSDMTVHFGLGNHTGNLDMVRIEWPSGLQETFLNVAPNQRIGISEATAIPEPISLVLIVVAGLIVIVRRRRSEHRDVQIT